MYYSKIKPYDVANGPGLRTTLFVSGCRNHCKGCFQPETWDFTYGQKFTEETEKEIEVSLKNFFVDGLTILGGEPFEEENQEDLSRILYTFRDKYPKKSIWCFTGYLLEDLLEGGRKHTEYTEKMLSAIDHLVEGPFIEEKKNLSLQFRGSENQRILKKENGIWIVDVDFA